MASTGTGTDTTKLFSYHSHSGQFCNHAKGTLEQVVQSAIHRRFTSLGLSEHMPRYKPEQLYPEEAHLTTEDLQLLFDEYLLEAARLQQKYKDQIDLFIGFETEYFDTQSISLINALRQPYRPRFCASNVGAGNTEKNNNNNNNAAPLPTIQYIVGSLHHLRGIPIDFSKELYLKALDQVGNGSWETLFQIYFDEQYQLLQGTQPEVIGHFDLIRLFFDAIDHHLAEDSQVRGDLSSQLWDLVKRNVAAVVEYGGLFELNSRSWKKGMLDAYPSRDIISAIKSAGGRFTLSDDSHGPDDIGMFYDSKLKDYLHRMDITEVYYLEAKESSSTSKSSDASSTESFRHVVAKPVLVKDLRFQQCE
ncbi:histidinolphosphatase [Podila humilis]|nr:histidinolphosphatase [Podila humilis]